MMYTGKSSLHTYCYYQAFKILDQIAFPVAKSGNSTIYDTLDTEYIFYTLDSKNHVEI